MSDKCNSHHGEHHSHDCGCESYAHHHHHGEKDGCHCAEKFLGIADEAWKEVLKDKIKHIILEHKGQHLDELAEIIAKANAAKWKAKISSKSKCNEYKDKLKEFFSSCE